MSDNTSDFLGTGRRKTAVARVRINVGSGNITINGRPYAAYFPLEHLRSVVIQPLTCTETLTKYDVNVNVRGGGLTGQAEATRHGIARALLQVDTAFRPLLKVEGFLTRDPRMKERKKYGQPGARRRYQYSKR
jgi:small subunit ribosomal protein S9